MSLLLAQWNVENVLGGDEADGVNTELSVTLLVVEITEEVNGITGLPGKVIDDHGDNDVLQDDGVLTDPELHVDENTESELVSTHDDTGPELDGAEDVIEASELDDGEIEKTLDIVL
jgi:hypothetical protein